MTTVIALNKGDSVIFASDSQATLGNTVSDIGQKFLEYPNLVVSTAGLGRVLQELRYNFKPPVFTKTDAKNPEKYVATKVLPAITKTLKNTEFLTAEDEFYNSFLVAVPGFLARLDSGLTILPCEEFTAIGSGAGFALGALEAGADVETALEIAIKYDAYTGGNVHVMEVKW